VILFALACSGLCRGTHMDELIRNGKSPLMSSSEVRANLEAQRTQALDQMIDEPERERRKVLRQNAEALEAAIASLPADQSQTEYGRFKNARDAVEAYLRNVGRPIRAVQIEDALIEGGMRRKPLKNANPTAREILDHTRTVIRKSISFHLINQRGIEAKVIKKLNGKVGLWEWLEERFQ
jgi:hypothetical protein